MCWKTSKCVEKKTDKNDFVVYKFIGKMDGRYFSPYQCTTIWLNEPLKLGDMDDNGFTQEIGDNCKHFGFHSYTKKATLYTLGAACYVNYENMDFTDFWDTMNGEFRMYLAECIIPKGSTYFVNENKEVVSDSLIVTDKMFSILLLKNLIVKETAITFEDLFGKYWNEDFRRSLPKRYC